MENNFKLLNEDDRYELCRIACDKETGHHLLYKRSFSYKMIAMKYVRAYDKFENHDELTDWELEALIYVDYCSDINFDFDKTKAKYSYGRE